jgi:bidirectional [NiFe] hydrogenase diaphorase subunit
MVGVADFATSLLVDGREVPVPEGGTILDACHSAGILVPSLCHMEGLSEVASCRVCLVEVLGLPQPVPACVTPAHAGMCVSTSTPALRAHRRSVAEMLFAGGHHVCAFCPASGRCELQELGTLTGLVDVRTGAEAPRWPVDASRARFALDPGRCILCTRCVRACSELEGAHALAVVGHGLGSRIATDGATWGESRACTDCGRCVTACPTGAIFEKSLAAQGLLPRHDRSAAPEPSPPVAGAARLRLATLWLGGCSGCHMSLLDLDARLLDLAPRIELVYSPLNDAKSYPGDVDVCLVEGAVATDEDADLLDRVRACTRLVVALGDCAVNGNVTAMRDGVGGAAAVRARSWSGPGGVPEREPGLPALLERVAPLRDRVHVDLSLPGCPPPADLLHLVLSDLVAGRSPDLEGLLRFG